jgi:hypothetical protein
MSTEIPFKKRMTVFVNPAAGDRTALGQWDSVSVMFKIAGIDVNKLGKGSYFDCSPRVSNNTQKRLVKDTRMNSHII